MRNTYLQLETRRQQAVRELTGMISTGYPATEFLIEPGIDDPEATHITAVVDVDDPDEVMDLVIDRLVELQVGAGLPISVIPIRTLEQTEALLRRQRRREGSEALLPSAQV